MPDSGLQAVDPTVVERIEQYVGDVQGVDEVASVRVRRVGHELHAEVGVILDDDRTLTEMYEVVAEVRRILVSYVTHLEVVAVEPLPRTASRRPVTALSILPPRYQDLNVPISAAPMGAAAHRYDENGDVAWDEIWTGFCELALAGGAPHRGTLLEPVHEEAIAADPEGYE